MKIRTVGALAALGMLLTSYSVWSLTEGPRGTTATASDTSGRRHDPGPSHDTVPASFFGDGTLAVDARLGHTTIPAGAPFETFVLVDVRAQDRGNGRPLSRHLAIVVDRSGSMRGKRMTNAIAAAQGAVRRLSDGD